MSGGRLTAMYMSLMLFLSCCLIGIAPLAQADSEKSRLSTDMLVEVIDASINTCNIGLAKNYMKQLGKLPSSKQSQFQRLDSALQDKMGQIDRHKKNLNELAKIIQKGEVDEIKQALRTAMTTISCPEDRMRLVEIVKRIQAALKQEAENNQKAMEYAINQGQYAQSESLRRRRLIGQTILLLVGSMDFGDASVPMPTIDKEQYLSDLATMGIQQFQTASSSSEDSPTGSSSTVCAVKDLDSLQNDSDKNNRYYLDIVSAEQSGQQHIVYQIKTMNKSMANSSEVALGPYSTLKSARMIADVLCPAGNRIN